MASLARLPGPWADRVGRRIIFPQELAAAKLYLNHLIEPTGASEVAGGLPVCRWGGQGSEVAPRLTRPISIRGSLWSGVWWTRGSLLLWALISAQEEPELTGKYAPEAKKGSEGQQGRW